MQIFFFRHAEKDITPVGNPELTSFGLLQAQQLKIWVQNNKLPRPDLIISSPKTRAEQSMIAVHKHSHCNLQKSEALLERQRDEDYEEFVKRIMHFIAQLEQYTQDVIYVCSHYDWLDLCTEEMGGHHFSWGPLNYAHYEYSEGIWSFKSFGAIR